MKVKPIKETDWQAEEDAYVLSKYNDIMNDKKRLKKAVAAAEKRAKEKEEEAEKAKESASMISKLK